MVDAPWTMDYGPWSLIYGNKRGCTKSLIQPLFTIDYKLWTMDYKPPPLLYSAIAKELKYLSRKSLFSPFLPALYPKVIAYAL